MTRGLTGFIAAVAKRRLRDFLLGVVAATFAALFATVSLGFALSPPTSISVRWKVASSRR